MRQNFHLNTICLLDFYENILVHELPAVCGHMCINMWWKTWRKRTRLLVSTHGMDYCAPSTRALAHQKYEEAGAAIGCSVAPTVIPYCPSSRLPHPELPRPRPERYGDERERERLLSYYSWNGGRAEAVCAGENE